MVADAHEMGAGSLDSSSESIVLRKMDAPDSAPLALRKHWSDIPTETLWSFRYKLGCYGNYGLRYSYSYALSGRWIG
jgi:hypothetical protein